MPEDPPEDVDALPVLADVRVIEPAAQPPLPTVQDAAVAGASFVVGAATIAALRRHRNRPPARRRRRAARRNPSNVVGEVVSSRSFLVDVHLLDRG